MDLTELINLTVSFETNDNNVDVLLCIENLNCNDKYFFYSDSLSNERTLNFFNETILLYCFQKNNMYRKNLNSMIFCIYFPKKDYKYELKLKNYDIIYENDLPNQVILHENVFLRPKSY